MDLNQDDVRNATVALMPTGPLWNFAEGTNFWLLADAMAAVDLVLEQYMQQLVAQEMNPATTYALLPQWENAYGLPDPDGPQNLSIADRQRALVARVTEVGGLTAAYLLRQIEAMGYPGATITQYSITTCLETCEDYLYDICWKKSFLVTLPVTVSGFGASCIGGCEDFLGAPFNSLIENYINRLKPADTFAIVAFAG